MDIVKGRYFFDIRFSNLANHLFLLFSELSRIDDWLSRLCLDWLGLCGSHWFWRVLFLFLSFLLQFCELFKLLSLFPLLFWVNIGRDNLRLGFGSGWLLSLGRWRLCLWLLLRGCLLIVLRTSDRLLLSCCSLGLHVGLLTLLNSLITHLLLICKYLSPFLLFGLTCFNG